MTVWDLLDSLRRRWYVAIPGILMTAALALVVLKVPGVYHEQVDVIFLAPAPGEHVNQLQAGSESLIDVAALVERVVDGSNGGAAPASDQVSLVGEGVRDGYSIRLPNDGGQWATNFSRPVLSVQATGSSPEEVSATINRAVARINDELAARQAAYHVSSGKLITTKLSPPTSDIRFDKGSRSRALAATMLLGCGLTLGSVVMVDRRKMIRTGERPSA